MKVDGQLRVPGDKSLSHRAVILGAIAEGETPVTGFLTGEDCLNTARALQAMGVRIEGLGGMLHRGPVRLTAHDDRDRFSRHCAPQRRIPKTGNRFSERIMLKQGNKIMIRSDRIMFLTK